VSGDVDFEARGLLDGLNGEARAARLELLERLHTDGWSLDDLAAAGADGRLLFLPAERVVGGEPKYSARQLAATSGVSLDLLLALRRANGLPLPDPDAVVFSEVDAEAADMTQLFRRAGLSDEQLVAITRVLGRGLSQAAEAMRSLVLELVLEPGSTEADLAERYARRVETFMPMLGPLLEQMIRVHLRHMVRTEAISAAERVEGTLPGARDVAVAFADLVGFTRLGEEVPPDELGRVADRLTVLTGEIVTPPVRLVKTIGDAVMLVSPDPEPLIGFALDLIAASDGEGERFPQLRVGLDAGAALSRAGDWYGRPVNVASRVTNVARPGSVLATRDVRDAAPEAFRWSSAGPRSLKGLPDPVRLYRARKLSQAAPPAPDGAAGDGSRPSKGAG
jgi:adenylate cyclase